MMTWLMNTGYVTKTIVVPAGIDPVRVDKYLASLPDLDLSRAFIQHLIADGQVRIDGVAASKNRRLKGGETIHLHIPPPDLPDLVPEDIPLDIVYEDEHLAVVNKPAGLVVHPAPGNPRHTLVNALLYHFGHLSGDVEDLRPGIIHRLDKNTSGLLLVAKTDPVARKLRAQLADRKITKTYDAVICGHMPERGGTIDFPIGRSMKDRKKMIVTNLRSRPAVTGYRVRDRFRINELVEVDLVTGRTHQIRVHFSHINRPVLGDPDYGGRQKWLRGIAAPDRTMARTLLEMIDRQALHARALGFVHPVTGVGMTLTSDPPPDMARLIDFLGARCR